MSEPTDETLRAMASAWWRASALPVAEWTRGDVEAMRKTYAVAIAAHEASRAIAATGPK